MTALGDESRRIPMRRLLVPSHTNARIVHDIRLPVGRAVAKQHLAGFVELLGEVGHT
jgi:hypothetical protein